jgi:hypothetical protein
MDHAEGTTPATWRRTPLTMYTAVSDLPELDWAWVEQQLAGETLYWVAAATDGHPHPRPVWGVWADDLLHLSIGTPSVRRAPNGTAVTVHLTSAIDVVIVEGHIAGQSADPALVAAYDAKYDYAYDADAYGPFHTIGPTVVIAWRSAGFAGKDGFREAGRWERA